MAEVKKGSRGVVGCTPILKASTCFQYFSGTDSDSEGGGSTMQGSFEMAVLDTKTGAKVRSFDAEIAPFTFLPPESFIAAAAGGEAGGREE